MTLEYSIDAKVLIDNSDCIKNLVITATEHECLTYHSRGKFLFTIIKDAEVLKPSESELFHHYVAKFFFSY